MKWTLEVQGPENRPQYFLGLIRTDAWFFAPASVELRGGWRVASSKLAWHHFSSVTRLLASFLLSVCFDCWTTAALGFNTITFGWSKDCLVSLLKQVGESKWMEPSILFPLWRRLNTACCFLCHWRVQTFHAVGWPGIRTLFKESDWMIVNLWAARRPASRRY